LGKKRIFSRFFHEKERQKIESTIGISHFFSSKGERQESVAMAAQTMKSEVTSSLSLPHLGGWSK